MNSPEISVVMSVYNGAKYLRRSVESILNQEGVDFEFVIVNDGSTDESGKILAEYAERDNRVRIINQENTGLTKALIRGCNEARGKYIARQDADDISLPGRLSAQAEYLKIYSESILVTCGVRKTLSNGQTLGEIWPAVDHQIMINNWRTNAMGIPAHGGVMFSRNVYHRVGGYREAFYYAQDRDLWLRMSSVGDIGCIRKILYELLLDIESISSSRQRLQAKFADLAQKCFELRKLGQNEKKLIEKVLQLRAKAMQNKDEGARYQQAGSYYRLAASIEGMDQNLSYNLYRKALKTCPFYFRAWRKLHLLIGHQQ
jgi:glycosyltransferase involved in cell wall biosynthesis